ncbi:MAG: dctA 1 [Chthoniobacteraceae bacterium]|nr:dctA 1 [Chthoniobacteraceae bacterium]
METISRPGFFARWHNTPLYIRILGGMVLGVLVGMYFGVRAEPLAIPSKLVLRVLGALAPPLILLAIMQALMSAQFERGTAGRLIRLLALNTLVAICIGLFVANVIKPGHWAVLKAPTTEEAAKAGGAPDLLQQFLENVPQSLLGPLGDNGRVMGVIFIAVAFGIAFRGGRNQTPSHTCRRGGGPS